MNPNVEKIEDYLVSNPSHGARRISRATGINLSAVHRALKHISRPSRVIGGAGMRADEVADLLNEKILDSGKPGRTIRTLDDLLKVSRTDLTVWDVERHVINKFDMAYKDDKGKACVVELFQVKAWLKRKAAPPDSVAIAELLKEFKAAKPVCTKLPTQKSTGNLLEISIPDLHYGSLSWSGETGEDYDSEIAEKRFLDAVRDLLSKGKIFGFDKILFPVGSDFFHVDNPENATTAGTRLDADTRWQRSFVRGCGVIRKAIEILRAHAPVEIVVISGNHDTTRAFYMGEVLAAVYSGCKDVAVNNSPKPRKYLRWGTVLLGFTHGDRVKIAALPNLMAGEAAEDWAKTTHREAHIGHLHHKQEHHFHAGREQNGVRIRVLPSLCSTDAWHSQNGYVGAQKAAEAYLWNLIDGYVGHFSFSPKSK